MSVKLITAPTEEPVTLAEMKLYLKLGADTTDDGLVSAMIKAMREQCENELKRAICTQTWELILDTFPVAIELPLPVTQSIVSVKYLDINGMQQTIDPTQYVLDSESQPAFLVPIINTCWPATGAYINAVRIRYVAGFGLASAVPENIKLWIKSSVFLAYENRQDIAYGTWNKLDYQDCLLDRYRIVQMF